MKQTSVHVKPVKVLDERHNRREKELSYVRQDLTQKNENWERQTRKEVYAQDAKAAKQLTGRKMQAKATPIREAVVVIDEHTTMMDLQNLADRYRTEFGIDCFQISIHRDEGHWHQSENGVEEWRPNLHAHMTFNWMDLQTGKSIKLIQGKKQNRKTGEVFVRDDMSRMQDIAAEVLHMGRGVSSDRRHLDVIQYKAKVEAEKVTELKQKATAAQTRAADSTETAMKAEVKAREASIRWHEAETRADQAEQRYEAYASKETDVKMLERQHKQLSEAVSENKKTIREQEKQLKQQQSELSETERKALSLREKASQAAKLTQRINTLSDEKKSLKTQNTALKAQIAGGRALLGTVKLWGYVKLSTIWAVSAIGKMAERVYDIARPSSPGKVKRLEAEIEKLRQDVADYKWSAGYNNPNRDERMLYLKNREHDALEVLKKTSPKDYERIIAQEKREDGYFERPHKTLDELKAEDAIRFRQEQQRQEERPQRSRGEDEDEIQHWGRGRGL